jgi:DNA-binding NarL/FixJ family response regulator
MTNQTTKKKAVPSQKSGVSQNRIRVLLADDHSIVREGIRALLESESDIEVIGEAETGREALELAKGLHPDVILMDIAMPLLNGLEATRQLQSLVPDSKVLILSAHSDDAYVEKVMSMGAKGFLIKQASFKILSTAIREVHKGNRFFSPTIEEHFRNHELKGADRASALNTKSVALSPREAEVLQLIAEGKANKQIASTLVISIKTVEKHRQHLMEKLKIHDTAGLTRYAIGAGIIESSIQLTVL